MIKKHINIDVYTTFQELIDAFPFEYASNNLPSWFKNLKTPIKKDVSDANVKMCPGITELYNNSIILYATQDYDIEIFNGQVNVETPNVYGAETHSLETQASGAWPGYVNVKIQYPYLLYCNTQTKFTMLPATWSNKDPLKYTTVPGQVEFKYNHHCHINLLVKNENKKFTIKYGTPLAMLVPVTDRKINFNHHLISFDDWNNKVKKWNFGWNRVYQRTKSLIERKK